MAYFTLLYFKGVYSTVYTTGVYCLVIGYYLRQAEDGTQQPRHGDHNTGPVSRCGCVTERVKYPG